ncbi:hypothetical protein QUA81_22375, partial [Microcoleus sp. F6_B4]
TQFSTRNSRSIPYPECFVARLSPLERGDKPVKRPTAGAALHNSGMILIFFVGAIVFPKACSFTAGGTPNPTPHHNHPPIVPSRINDN